MPHDEVDDTAMTPAEFRAARERGIPVRVVTSREEYEAVLASRPSLAFYANHHLNVASVGAQPGENLPASARAAS